MAELFIVPRTPFPVALAILVVSVGTAQAPTKRSVATAAEELSRSTEALARLVSPAVVKIFTTSYLPAEGVVARGTLITARSVSRSVQNLATRPFGSSDDLRAYRRNVRINTQTESQTSRSSDCGYVDPILATHIARIARLLLDAQRVRAHRLRRNTSRLIRNSPPGIWNGS